MSGPSRLMIAPRSSAARKSSSGVSFEESMMSRPVTPARSASKSSTPVAQSQPQPHSARTRSMAGLGVALTAKYSLKPGFQAKAAESSAARRRISASS